MLRLLRLRLSARREAVDAADLARGCGGGRRADRRRDEGAARARRERPRRGVDAGAVHVRTCAVVVAAGRDRDSGLLLRSGLRNPNVGRGLRLHPATAVFGIFDEEIRPWEGTMQALYSDQHRHLDDGYGVKYETVPAHPALLTAALPWDGAAEHARLMASLPRLSGIAVIPRDRGSGRVRIGRDGEPIVTYRLAPDDARRLATGVDGAGRIMAAAGAREVFTRERAPAAVHGRLPRRRVSLRSRPRRALLVPHHGLGPDGRLAGDLGGEPGG